MSYIVHIDSLFGDRGVVAVISLLEHRGGELLLTLAESVSLGGASVDWLCHASFSFPVSIGAEGILSRFPIILNGLSLQVATSKDARLKLLVLLVSCVVTVLHILALLRGGGIESLLACVLPVCTG